MCVSGGHAVMLSTLKRLAPDWARAAARSLLDSARAVPTQYREIRRHARLTRERDAAFLVYLNQSFRGLHVGAEFYALENWFNTDLTPLKPGIYYLDATEPLPFPSHSFDFIFSEHMIEHIPLASGLKFLAECRRVLKPSGILRIATPNLRNILALGSNHDPRVTMYLEWAAKFSALPTSFPLDTMVINNFFRAWGHQFLYDPETLTTALQQASFRDITRAQVGLSGHFPLQGLERHGDTIGQWVNEFETMVFEARA